MNHPVEAGELGANLRGLGREQSHGSQLPLLLWNVHHDDAVVGARLLTGERDAGFGEGAAYRNHPFCVCASATHRHDLSFSGLTSNDARSTSRDPSIWTWTGARCRWSAHGEGGRGLVQGLGEGRWGQRRRAEGVRWSGGYCPVARALRPTPDASREVALPGAAMGAKGLKSGATVVPWLSW